MPTSLDVIPPLAIIKLGCTVILSTILVIASDILTDTFNDSSSEPTSKRFLPV